MSSNQQTDKQTQGWQNAESQQREGKPQPQGYWQKYRVIDNTTGEELTEKTFTMKIETDPHARAALLAYAQSCESMSPELAADIRGMFPGGTGTAPFSKGGGASKPS